MVERIVSGVWHWKKRLHQWLFVSVRTVFPVMAQKANRPDCDCRPGIGSGGFLVQVLGALTIVICLFPTAGRSERVTYQDTHGDDVARRMDIGADGPLDTLNHKLPDLLSWTIGSWRPVNAQTDLFIGNWANNGEFFRLDLVFKDIINPPGPLGCCGEPAFDPFRYGPNPISGYIEIDMDRDVNSGGELDWPDLRYLGNVARFGGLPQQATLKDRAAINAGAFDNIFTTPPYVERSGEDFHLEMVGWEIDSNQIQRSDPSDWLFSAGETWTITGHFLHRAHGYSPFSSACCRSGVPIGNYEPIVKIQFSHNTTSNRTTVSLVYPLTNSGSAVMTGSPTTEPMDILFTNQNSVSEALWELAISAIAATPEDRSLPEYALIAPWESKNPDDYLDPALWRVSVLVGGSYTTPQDALFVWSDIYPDVKIGDLDGDGTIGSNELALFDVYMMNNDGNPAIDYDGVANGVIEIISFGPNFSLYDLNYDGLIDDDDRAMIGGPLFCRMDFDHDGDVDLIDFSHMQLCLTSGSGPVLIGPGCRNADLDHDNDVDQADIQTFVGCSSGPAIPANPMCGRTN